MQLIQLSKPASVDIQNTMSTLEETLESSQMKGELPEIKLGCATTKNSPNEKNTILPTEDVTMSIDNNRQNEDKIKDRNGAAKTNDKQYSDKIETELSKDNIDVNETSPIIENNGSTVLSDPCRCPVSSTDIISSAHNDIDVEEKNENDLNLINDLTENQKDENSANDLNDMDVEEKNANDINSIVDFKEDQKKENSITNLSDIGVAEKNANDLNTSGDFKGKQEKANGTNDLNNIDEEEKKSKDLNSSVDLNEDQKELNCAKKLNLNVEIKDDQNAATSNLLNDENAIDDISMESDVKLPNVDELKSMDISVENKIKALDVSAFSPNSDSVENDINISEQLQHLEDDKLMETDVNITKNNRTASQLEQENEKPIETSSKKLEQKSRTLIADPNETNYEKVEETLETAVENQLLDKVQNENNIDIDTQVKEDLSTENQSKTIEEKLEQKSDTFLDLPTQLNAEKIAFEAIENQLLNNVQDNGNVNTETKENSKVSLEKQPTETTDEKLEKQLNTSLNHLSQTDAEKVEAFEVAIEKQLLNNVQDNGKFDTEMKENSKVSLEKQLIETTDEKPENQLNTSLDHLSQTDAEKVEAFEVAIDNHLSINDHNDSKDDIIMDEIKSVSTVETIDISDNVDTVIEQTPSVQKYIKVRNFVDMVDAPVNVTADKKKSCDIVLDNQLLEENQSQNKVIDVDSTDVVPSVTSENSIEKLHLSHKDTEVENIVEMIDNIITEDTAEENKSKTPNFKENPVTIDINIDGDNNVMEVDDDEVVTNSENKIVDTSVGKSEATSEDKAYEETETTRQDTVINIADNEDEDIRQKINKSEHSKIKRDEVSEIISIDDISKVVDANDSNKDFNLVESVDEKDTEVITKQKPPDETKLTKKENQEKISEKKVEKTLPVVCKLSNTMDILSDDEDDPPCTKSSEEKQKENNKPNLVNNLVNLDDDDDIMFIEDSNSQSSNGDVQKSNQNCNPTEPQTSKTTNIETSPDHGEKEKNSETNLKIPPEICLKDDSSSNDIAIQPKEDIKGEPSKIKETKPLISPTFLDSATKNIADMTRNELEDFCILKLVESIVDKGNLNEIKTKMKTMAQSIEELRKKSIALTKQNRDLQVVVKTVQEDQKKRNSNPMMPMKITRSVGLQVVLSGADKGMLKKKLAMPPPAIPGKPTRNIPSPKILKPTANNIPVPRLVPASSPTVKSPSGSVNSATKIVTNIKPTITQRPEKRPLSKSSSASSVVDLTDDEPPAKKSVAPPVRLVPPQNLMPKNRPQSMTGNSPRKVYIPISSSNPAIRPPPVIKNFIPSTPRPRQPAVVRMQTVRMNSAPLNRHPAPLPDAMKQYQPPTWKALPPAPDLKLSKVDNGIVISWKFEGYQPDTYEEVASFQLYAYQETPAPPSTALWKKIGDIKALPLPMACTLTQFMSGFKYYFAVRAIDVRSRIGPFSLPGSIMLISKS